MRLNVEIVAPIPLRGMVRDHHGRSERFDTAAGMLAAVRKVLDARSGTPQLETLTARECAVLELMASGLDNAEIAEELSMSRRTIEWYVSEIFRKLEIDGNARGARRVRAVLAYLSAGD